MDASSSTRSTAGTWRTALVAAAGTLLVAATYGMARFGVGLFAPRLVDERPDLAPAVGWAAGAQFLSYAFAALVAARLSDRRPRQGVALAGATAALGCAGVAVSSTPATFVLSTFVGGMGAGFASPALVRVVDAVVSGPARATTQSLVNTGTAFGVVASGVIVLSVAGTTPAWLLMAAATAGAAALVLVATRDREGLSGAPGDATGGAAPAVHGSLVPAAVAAATTGVGSALIWTYGPLLASREGVVDGDRTGLMWIALGLGGLLGPATGVVVERLGLTSAWRLFAGLLVLADLVLAASLALDLPWATYAAMALFGAGYMCLSGVLILWARRVRPGSAGAGTAMLFVALAVGQALGAVLVEPGADVLGAVGVTLVAAALCLLGGSLALSTPRR